MLSLSRRTGSSFALQIETKRYYLGMLSNEHLFGRPPPFLSLSPAEVFWFSEPASHPPRNGSLSSALRIHTKAPHRHRDRDKPATKQKTEETSPSVCYSTPKERCTLIRWKSSYRYNLEFSGCFRFLNAFVCSSSLDSTRFPSLSTSFPPHPLPRPDFTF